MKCSVTRWRRWLRSRFTGDRGRAATFLPTDHLEHMIRDTRTYLELRSLGDLQRGVPPAALPDIVRLERCTGSLFRHLYSEVGRHYRWTDRLAWTDEEIQCHLANPAVHMWLARWQDEPAGYFELRSYPDRSVQLVYLGLRPDFIGRGWGKVLLVRAADEAWWLGATRMWLHTSTFDHAAALPNYLKRGFQLFHSETLYLGTPA